MTKRQRGQVVELLRCAADSSDPRRYQGINGLILAAMCLRSTDKETELAGKVYNELHAGPSLTWEHYRANLLEAAQRVEEGSWP